MNSNQEALDLWVIYTKSLFWNVLRDCLLIPCLFFQLEDETPRQLEKMGMPVSCPFSALLQVLYGIAVIFLLSACKTQGILMSVFPK